MANHSRVKEIGYECYLEAKQEHFDPLAHFGICQFKYTNEPMRP
jgi:hypothetical protein